MHREETSAPASPPVSWRRLGIEAGGSVAAILVLPVLATWAWERYAEALQQFGVGTLISMVAGNGGWTDIGWEVASAKALVLSGFSAYDSLDVIHPLIGMEIGFSDPSSHSHPPTSIPLGLPLVPFDYAAWLPYWIVVAILMLAWSMRLLAVPAHIAYPLALAVTLSVPGRWGILSSYPVAALALSWAWYSRQRWLSAGLAYGLFGAMRGVGLLLLLYPILRRQWKAVITAVATVVVLFIIAGVIEPDVMSRWLTTSRASIEATLTRPDLLTPGAILQRQGVSAVVVYAVVLAVAVAAYLRGSNAFWILAWVILAASPVAWFHSTIQGLPLLVMMWTAGRFGRAAVLIVGASAMTQLVDPLVTLVFSITWVTFVIAGGLTLLVNRVGPPERLPLLDPIRAALTRRKADRVPA